MIIWDTEFTSWEGCNENGWDEEDGEYKELIQIGACKVDNEKYSIVDTFEVIIKPRINSELSEYIQDLTGITQSRIDYEGIDFEEAIDKFEDFCGRERRYSFGDDLDIFKYNSDLYDCDIEVSSDHYYDIRDLLKGLSIPTDEYTSGELYKYHDLDVKINTHDAVEDSLSMVLTLQANRNDILSDV